MSQIPRLRRVGDILRGLTIMSDRDGTDVPLKAHILKTVSALKFIQQTTPPAPRRPRCSKLCSHITFGMTVLLIVHTRTAEPLIARGTRTAESFVVRLREAAIGMEGTVMGVARV